VINTAIEKSFPEFVNLQIFGIMWHYSINYRKKHHHSYQNLWGFENSWNLNVKDSESSNGVV
jgi:hypothetical protein